MRHRESAVCSSKFPLCVLAAVPASTRPRRMASPPPRFDSNQSARASAFPRRPRRAHHHTPTSSTSLSSPTSNASDFAVHADIADIRTNFDVADVAVVADCPFHTCIRRRRRRRVTRKQHECSPQRLRRLTRKSSLGVRTGPRAHHVLSVIHDPICPHPWCIMSYHVRETLESCFRTVSACRSKKTCIVQPFMDEPSPVVCDDVAS